VLVPKQMSPAWASGWPCAGAGVPPTAIGLVLMRFWDVPVLFAVCRTGRPALKSLPVLDVLLLMGQMLKLVLLSLHAMHRAAGTLYTMVLCLIGASRWCTAGVRGRHYQAVEACRLCVGPLGACACCARLEPLVYGSLLHCSSAVADLSMVLLHVVLLMLWLVVLRVLGLVMLGQERGILGAWKIGACAGAHAEACQTGGLDAQGSSRGPGLPSCLAHGAPEERSCGMRGLVAVGVRKRVSSAWMRDVLVDGAPGCIHCLALPVGMASGPHRRVQVRGRGSLRHHGAGSAGRRARGRCGAWSPVHGTAGRFPENAVRPD